MATQALAPVVAGTVDNAEWWIGARERLAREEEQPGIGDALSGLLDVIDDAWPHLHALQAAASATRALVLQNSSLAGLLDFIETDVLDVFRSLAEDCTGFVSAAYGGEAAPERDDVVADAEDLARSVAVLGFAASSSAVSERLSRAMREASDGLRGWERRFAARLERVGRHPAIES